MTTGSTDSRRRPFTQSERTAVARKSSGRCGICGCPLLEADRFAVDHIAPVKEGGSNDLANLQAAHERCNGMKSAREKPDWTTDESSSTRGRPGSNVYDRAFGATRYVEAIRRNDFNPFVRIAEAPDGGDFIRQAGVAVIADLLHHGACVTSATGEVLPVGRDAVLFVWPHVAARANRYNGRVYSLICPAKADKARMGTDRRKGEDETRRRVAASAELWLAGLRCTWPCNQQAGLDAGENQ